MNEEINKRQRTSSVEIESKESFEMPQELLAYLTTFVPHRWYLRVVCKSWSRVLQPPKKIEKLLICQDIYTRRSEEISYIHRYLCDTYNALKIFRVNETPEVLATIRALWEKYPNFKRIEWSVLLQEQLRSLGRWPDANFDPMLSFYALSTFDTLNLASDRAKRAANWLLAELTNMSQFLEGIKIQQGFYVLQITVLGKAIRAQSRVTAKTAKPEERAFTVVLFKIEFLKFVIKNYTKVDTIVAELKDSSQFIDPKVLLVRKTSKSIDPVSHFGVTYHDPPPTYSFWKKVGGWFCELIHKGMSVKVAASKKSEAKDAAAKLWMDSYITSKGDFPSGLQLKGLSLH